MSNGPYIVDETCLVFAKNIEEENERLRAEIEKLRREAAVRIDQIEREQEAHLKTMADLNKQAEMNSRLLTENASLRAENKELRLELDMQQATILVPSQKDDQRRIERLDAALKEALDEAAQLRRDVKTAVMGDSAELQDVKRENEKLREALSEAEGHLEYAYMITFRDRLRDAAIAARSALAAIRESGE